MAQHLQKEPKRPVFLGKTLKSQPKRPTFLWGPGVNSILDLSPPKPAKPQVRGEAQHVEEHRRGQQARSRRQLPEPRSPLLIGASIYLYIYIYIYAYYMCMCIYIHIHIHLFMNLSAYLLLQQALGRHDAPIASYEFEVKQKERQQRAPSNQKPP